jgi:hypothetical protein
MNLCERRKETEQHRYGDDLHEAVLWSRPDESLGRAVKLTQA